MTREEAIKIINCYDIGFYDLSGEKIPADKLVDAFDMAIEALQEQERDGCEGCRYELEPADYEACERCSNNYLNLWEPEPKAKEFTADDLIGEFRDAFVERRAIGILDIENKVKELFE